MHENNQENSEKKKSSFQDKTYRCTGDITFRWKPLSRLSNVCLDWCSNCRWYWNWVNSYRKIPVKQMISEQYISCTKQNSININQVSCFVIIPLVTYCCCTPTFFLGVAALIRIGLVEQYKPFISAIARFLSLSSANLTNP